MNNESFHKVASWPTPEGTLVEIKPIGSYFEIDMEGFLKNPASIEKIQSKWKPAVDAGVEAYKNHFKDKLVSVYVRGSVAKGEAREGVSDIDMFAYVDIPENELQIESLSDEEQKLSAQFPFVEKFELVVDPINDAHRHTLLLNQSVCVWGKEVGVSRIKPNRDIMNHTRNFERNTDRLQEELGKADTPERMRELCSWYMKQILRTGFELTMERSGRYTRDLYLCYKDFAEYYPLYASDMKDVLWFALNPTDDTEKIQKTTKNIAAFLVEESKSMQKK